MIELSRNYEKIYNNIIDITGAYIQKHKLNSLVVGLSGGIDSTLTASLAHQIKSTLDVPFFRVIGVSIPSKSNYQIEIDRARMAGEAFCDDFREIGKRGVFIKPYILDSILRAYTWRLKPYNKIFSTQGRSILKSRACKVGRGNLKARIRMAILYDIAHHNNGMVLSTDNYTEYMLGFWTLHGDVGDFGMLQNLFKTEVYGLARYVSTLLVKGEWKSWKLPAQIEALRESAAAVSTDGNGLGTDMDQLGASNYYQIDQILLKHLNEISEDSSHIIDRVVNHHIIERHKNTGFKRDNPYNIPRESLLK